VEHVPPAGRTQRLDWTPLERETAELPRRSLHEASPSPGSVADRAREREPAQAAEPCVTGTEGCLDVSMRVGQPVELLNPVLFGTGRDALPLDVEASLGAVVVVLNAHPELVRVAIEGHTDSVGDERGNLALSRRRAVAVMRWLVEHGVDERRLQVRAFGPRYPRFGNDVEEDRARNRRVEFTVVERDSRGRAAWHNGPARTSDASRGNP
jgi:outer membrane protein OmpA-like peptidoglycan-associated protein